MKNKGFSLIELIIVIAIMAILVGVMAPILIKYIEKTNVSADAQLCDTIREAINIARSDPDVRSDEDSIEQIDYLEDGSLYSIAYFTDQTLFTDTVSEITGVDIIGMGGTGSDNVTNSRKFMKSRVAKNSGVLMMQMNGNNLYVWIDHSDFKGGDTDHTCTTYANVESSGVIYAR